MNLELVGTRALVTGGSRGIGRAIVTLLAEEGCSVEFCAHTAPRVSEVETLLAAAGHSIKGSSVDLQDPQAARHWAIDAVARLGGLEILVCNASAMATGDSDEAWQKNYAIEIAGLRDLVAVAHPHLKEAARQRGDAAVVAVGSTAAGNADSFDAYGAVKAALVRTMKGLSRSLIKDGIRANMVSPGPVFSDEGIWARVESDDPERFRRKVSEIPLGRMGTPEEIANAVVFLCSARARYIVGSNIIMDGGRSDRPQY